jgi:hypothetical protein
MIGDDEPGPALRVSHMTSSRDAGQAEHEEDGCDIARMYFAALWSHHLRERFLVDGHHGGSALSSGTSGLLGCFE